MMCINLSVTCYKNRKISIKLLIKMGKNKQYLPKRKKNFRRNDTHRVRENTFGGLFDIPVLQ